MNDYIKKTGYKYNVDLPSERENAQSTADKVAWAMAQDDALSKMKLFSSMAKQVNDQ